MIKCHYVGKETIGLMLTYPFCCEYHLNKARDHMEEQFNKEVLKLFE